MKLKLLNEKKQSLNGYLLPIPIQSLSSRKRELKLNCAKMLLRCWLSFNVIKKKKERSQCIEQKLYQIS